MYVCRYTAKKHKQSYHFLCRVLIIVYYWTIVFFWMKKKCATILPLCLVITLKTNICFIPNNLSPIYADFKYKMIFILGRCLLIEMRTIPIFTYIVVIKKFFFKCFIFNLYNFVSFPTNYVFFIGIHFKI